MPYDQKPGLDQAAIDSWEASVQTQDKLTMLSFGHINKGKCIDLILASLSESRILRSKVRYIIAGFPGSPEYIETLREIVKSRSLEDIVTFELGVSDKRLVALKSLSDIFINLRYPNTEGSSVSVVEQLATGKPTVVYDTGCYAEIPKDAAYKVAFVNSVAAIGNVLESLVSNKVGMIERGRRGRTHALEISCESYMTRLLTFILAHRDELVEKAAFALTQLAISPLKAKRPSIDDHAWAQGIAQSRLSFEMLDKGIVVIEPALIASMTDSELSKYIGTVIFGSPLNEPIAEAALVSISTMSQDRRYWACVYFYLLSCAIFDGNMASVSRLAAIGPVLDLALWGVVIHLPAKALRQVGSLMLTGALLTNEQLDECQRDIEEGYPAALRVLNTLNEYRPRYNISSAEYSLLAKYLDKGPERSADYTVNRLSSGKVHLASRDDIRLVGFYSPEAEGVWTSSNKAYAFISVTAEVLSLRISFNVVYGETVLGRWVRVSIVGTDICDIVRPTDDGTKTVTLLNPTDGSTDPEADPERGNLILVFEVNELVRPSDMGETSDTRAIGIHLTSLDLLSDCAEGGDFQ